MNKLKLQTVAEIDTPVQTLEYDSSILLVGSCFTEHIGQLLARYKFDTVLNPCGIVYNPLSVENSLSLVLGKEKLQENDFIFHNGMWHSMFHHGSYSHAKREKLLVNTEKDMTLAKKKLLNASHVFLTLGTAWVFEFVDTRRIVSNCHKLPANRFRHYRLTQKEVCESLQRGIEMIREVNPSAEVVFTVSPIRHLKNGTHGNQLSKATLLLGIDEVVSKENKVGYFPAYEIVMDELRDYRFFAEDMSHLSPIAVQYIWERFCEHYVTEESRQYFSLLDKLHKAMNHRFINAQGEEYSKFVLRIQALLQNLQKVLPQCDFSKELTTFFNEN